uniref:LOW QUALITY PROTEIN: cytochrome b5 reductase 4-like n=1 Tax=Styela clava TaxID=7725 RepID=UPI00193960E3|nr:LOW QUALITY PROTEIN: cytochrome b5 reductase 4-like [Styela clava]
MFPSLNSQQRLSVNNPSKPSKKVPLKPGRSLVDWIQRTKSGEDLKKTGPRLLRITTEELAKHNKPNDMWMALRGMVYNVTAYLEYHPGGADELMRGAGRDATSLFEEVHRWVNYESMLKECLIGKLIDTNPKHLNHSILAPPASLTSLNPLGVNTLKIDSVGGTAAGVPEINLEDYTSNSDVSISLPNEKSSVEPTLDWYQTTKTIVIVLYTKIPNFSKDHVICDLLNKNSAVLDLHVGKILHTFHIALNQPVLCSIHIAVTSIGNVQVVFTKMDPKIHWSTLGDVRRTKENFSGRDVSKLRTCECSIASKVTLTHDTDLYHIKMPCSRRMYVPKGYHVYLKTSIDNIEVQKPYTPVLKSILNENAEKSLETGCDFIWLLHYESGALTSALGKLSPNNKISVSVYDGDFDAETISKYSTYILLAAGTGITPMIRVLYSMLQDRDDSHVHLLFFNKRIEDIIWRDDLDAFSENYHGRFFTHNILSQADESWNGRRGRISKEMLEEYLSKIENFDKNDILFYICGPTLFTNSGLSIIKELGFPNVHAFT